MNTPASVVYFEIPAPNIEIAGAFYDSVFGWKAKQSGPEYLMLDTGAGISGGLDGTKSATNGGVVFYIKVDNISATLAAIQRSGGVVIRSKFEIGGGHGFSALFKDPNGNHLGLWSSE